MTEPADVTAIETAAPPRRWRLVALLAVLALFGLGLPPADAQDNTPPPAGAPAATPEEDDAAEAKAAEEEGMEQVGEEIVVTARRREENLQEVPIAVTVVTGDRLEETAAADISELQGQVPNLAIYQGRNQSSTLTAFMRGIGQADPLWGVDPGVGLYIDDVYLARPQGALLDVYDVGRIEVLRGPQGTLYGKNTIGGAIKYVSRPLTDDTSAMISVSPGTQSNLDLRASFAGALIPGKVRGKLAIASLQHEGYGTNLYTGRDVSDRKTLAARGGLDWLVSEDVKVAVSLDFTRDDAEPKGYQRLAANPLCPLFLGATCPPLDDRWDTQSGLAPVNGTDSMGASMVISWDVNDAWLFKSITAYRESDSENNIDFDTTPARITDVQATYYDNQVSQEFQFIYDAGSKLTGVLGLYYFDGEAGGLVKNIFLNRIFGTTDGKTLTDSLALFGEGSYAFSDQWTFNLGLRATRETKNGIAFNAGYTNDTFTVVNAITADYDKEETFDSIAPKLGVDYRFSDSAMGYFTLSRGFKSGGFNVRAQSTIFPESAEPFDDEVLTVGEARPEVDPRGRPVGDELSHLLRHLRGRAGLHLHRLRLERRWHRGRLLRQLPERRQRHHEGRRGRVRLLESQRRVVRPQRLRELPRPHPGRVPRREQRRLRRHPGDHQRPRVHRRVARELRLPGVRRPVDRERRRRLPRRRHPHQRGRTVSGASGPAAAADLPAGLRALRRLGLLALAQRQLAPGTERQEPDGRGVPDQRLQHPVARHPDGLVRRPADLHGHGRVPVLLGPGR